MIRVISLVGFLLVCVGVSWAQVPAQLPKIEPFGIDGFQLMLQQQGLETVQLHLAAAMRAPEETVIVLMGDLGQAGRIGQGLEAFVRDGGALLVATDLGGGSARRPQRMRWLFQTEFRNVGMRFSHDGLFDPRYGDCPLVTNLDASLEPELFAGVQGIAANLPGYLVASEHVREVAWLPKSVRPHPTPVPLVGTCRTGKGRMLLVADHSVFINEMLIRADNARFANNVAHWLTADGRRKHVVVCLNNELLPEWSFVGTPPTVPLKDLLRNVQRNGLAGLPTGDALLPMLNQSLVDFERQNGINHYLWKVTGSRKRTGTANLRGPLLLVTALLLLLALRWFLVTRGTPRPWAFSAADACTSETRLAAALSEQHAAPVLRTLIREFFAEAGVSRFSEPSYYPQIQLHESVSSAKATLARVHQLWDLATSDHPNRPSAKKARMLTQQLRDLYHLHAQGLLKLE